MFENLMIIGLILIIIAIVIMIKLNKNIRELLKQSKEEEKKETKRTHPTISKAKFDNVLLGRTNVYDKYKNKDGLYEPVITKNGIEIKSRKGE